MKVQLINFTPNPLKTISFVYRLMREKNIIPVDELDADDAVWITKKLINDNLNTPLEFISTVWLFEDVTRAFQQQLTRHRTFGFCIQSMRVVDKQGFAERKEYLIPDDVKDVAFYRKTMTEIENLYDRLLSVGEPVQAARGMLPLNIYSPISMVANMRGLLAMFEQRMCRQVQGEFKEVILAMIDEIRNKISPVFVSHLKEPCLKTGKCIMSAENELRAIGKDALGRKPCELYENVRSI